MKGVYNLFIFWPKVSFCSTTPPRTLLLAHAQAEPWIALLKGDQRTSSSAPLLGIIAGVGCGRLPYLTTARGGGEHLSGLHELWEGQGRKDMRNFSFLLSNDFSFREI